ncbi:hypothetical protein STEG23_010154, partial [Scotinomys teguina]
WPVCEKKWNGVNQMLSRAVSREEDKNRTVRNACVRMCCMQVQDVSLQLLQPLASTLPSRALALTYADLRNPAVCWMWHWTLAQLKDE